MDGLQVRAKGGLVLCWLRVSCFRDIRCYSFSHFTESDVVNVSGVGALCFLPWALAGVGSTYASYFSKCHLLPHYQGVSSLDSSCFPSSRDSLSAVMLVAMDTYGEWMSEGGGGAER
jgi:hypothetical protein